MDINYQIVGFKVALEIVRKQYPNIFWHAITTQNKIGSSEQDRF